MVLAVVQLKHLVLNVKVGARGVGRQQIEDLAKVERVRRVVDLALASDEDEDTGTGRLRVARENIVLDALEGETLGQVLHD